MKKYNADKDKFFQNNMKSEEKNEMENLPLLTKFGQPNHKFMKAFDTHTHKHVRKFYLIE